MGDSIVTTSKWTVLAVSLSFTLGYVIEHFYLNPASMPWYIYFKSLRTELVEIQGGNSKSTKPCLKKDPKKWSKRTFA